MVPWQHWGGGCTPPLGLAMRRPWMDRRMDGRTAPWGVGRAQGTPRTPHPRRGPASPHGGPPVPKGGGGKLRQGWQRARRGAGCLVLGAGYRILPPQRGAGRHPGHGAMPGGGHAAMPVPGAAPSRDSAAPGHRRQLSTAAASCQHRASWSTGMKEHSPQPCRFWGTRLCPPQPEGLEGRWQGPAVARWPLIRPQSPSLAAGCGASRHGGFS